MNASKLVGAIVLLASPMAVACSHENPPPPQPSGAYAQTNMQGGSVDEAAEEIAHARCDLEQSCNNVGPHQKYESHDACLEQARSNERSDLRAEQCPAGIDQRQLDKCLSEIKGERCGNVLDTMSRLAACRTSELCER